MSLIELEYRSRGGNTTLQELRRIQAALNSTAQGTSALARNLNLSFTSAQNFARSLGITTDRANQAVNIIRDLRSANANLGQQYREVNRQLGLSRQQFLALNRQLESSRRVTTEALGGLAIASGILARELTQNGRVSIEVYTELAATLNQFQALRLGEDIEPVRNEVLRLGSETSRTATEIGAAAVALARMGLNAEQVANILPAVTRGAIATNTSTDVLSQVLGRAAVQFGETNASARRYAEISDLLVNTANSSATNIENLGQALGFVGGTAQNAGQDIETVLAVLGLFANSGIESTRAGTALANIFTRLRNAAANIADPTNDAGRALATLGVTITDSQGQLLDFAEILPQILDALRDIEDVGQRGLLLGELFDLRQTRDFNNLLNQSNEEIAQFIEQIRNSAGTADASAAILLQGLPGAFAEFNSALEALRIETGETFSTVLEPVVRGATALIRTFQSLPAPLRVTVLSLAGFNTVLLAAIATVTSLVAANRLLGFSEALVASRVLAANTAKALGTAISNAAAIATGRATAANVAYAASSGQVAAAETARAGAISAANAATIASLTRLTQVAGLAAIALVGLAPAATVFTAIDERSREGREGTEQLRESFEDLQDVLERTEAAAQGVSEELKTIAEQNFEDLEESVGFFERLFVRLGTLGQTGAVDIEVGRVNRQLLDDLLITQQILDEVNNFREGVEENGEVNQEVFNSLISSLEEAQAVLQASQPVTEESVQLRDEFVTKVQEQSEALQELNRTTGDSIELQNASAEATQFQANAIRELQQELQNQFSDRQIVIRNEFEDQNTNRQRVQARAIENIRDRQQQLRNDEQRLFAEEIENLRRDEQRQRDEVSRQLEADLQEQRRQNQERLQAAERQFTTEQENRQENFTDEIRDRRREVESSFDNEIDLAQQEINRRLQLDNARGASERRRLRRQFREEDEQTRARARLEQRLLQPILEDREFARQQLLDEEEEFNAEQLRLKSEFETNTLNPLKLELEQQVQQQRVENENQLRDLRFAAEDEIRNLRTDFDRQQADKKRTDEQKLIQLRQDFEDKERDKKRSFAQEQRNRQREFNDELQRVNQQNADELRKKIQAPFPTIPVPAPPPTFRDGGQADAGYAIVGEAGAELVHFNRPGYVYTADETRDILNNLNFERGSNSGEQATAFNSQPSFSDSAILSSLNRIEQKLKTPKFTQNNTFQNTVGDNPSTNEIMRLLRSNQRELTRSVVKAIKDA